MKISASLYAADPMRLGEQIEAVSPHVASLHLDVMDGTFAPAFGLGDRVVQVIASRSILPVDVHLMVSDPGRWARVFAESGAHRVAFHWETTGDPRGTARDVRACGALAYLALLPTTPVSAALDLLSEMDGVLLLTAPPGGGPFDDAALARVLALPKNTAVIVDGAIEPRHFATLRRAPVELVVVGRALFASANVAERAKQLQTDLSGVAA